MIVKEGIFLGIRKKVYSLEIFVVYLYNFYWIMYFLIFKEYNIECELFICIGEF